ncbi:MAG: hypothetical protein AABZ50_04500 [Pseudomonadota bacterium]
MHPRAIRFSWRFVFPPLVWLLAWLPMPAAVAMDGVSLEAVRQQIDQLKRESRATEEKLRALEQRLRDAEALQQRGKGLPSADPVPPASGAPAAEPEPPAPVTMTPPAPEAAEGQDKKVVREAPKSKSATAVYQEQHAVFDRRFTLETGFSYSHFDRKQISLSGFLALDAIFLGDISVDTVKADILTFDVLGRWGLSNRLQVDLAAPFLYRRTIYQSTANSQFYRETVTQNPDVQVGDISAGLYYQLSPETITRPDIVWNFRLKAPTGTHPYGVKLRDASGGAGILTAPTELPSGNGVWSVSTGLSFVKTVDPAILFANVGYFYNFSRRFDDLSTQAGTQTPGRVKLGDSLQFGLGTAFALSERTSLSFSYAQRFSARSRTRLDGGGWSSVPGSDANSATFNFGLTHALSDRASMVTNLGIGLTPDAPDLQLTIKFPYSF